MLNKLSVVMMSCLLASTALAVEPDTVASAEVLEEVLTTAPLQSQEDLDEMEDSLTSLESRLLASRESIALLKDMIDEQTKAGSRLILVHDNHLGPFAKIETASYFIDGQMVYSRSDPSGEFDDARNLQILGDSLEPGEHRLEVVLVVRGSGGKVFSYLNERQTQVRGEYDFTIDRGNVTVLKATADSKGLIKSFDRRLLLTFDEHMSEAPSR